MEDGQDRGPPAGRAVPARIDGRRLRSERTKQLIIEAYLALLRENPEVPTAVQIAKRAGYSVRSVFERFEDLLALSFAAADYAFAAGMSQAIVRDVDGDRAARIRSQVETRAGICEQWLPLWRVLLHNQRESPLLAMRIDRMRDAVWARLMLMYRPELSPLADADRTALLITLEALTDFESWARMRERHGLSVEAARDVWIRAIDRLLPPTPERLPCRRPIRENVTTIHSTLERHNSRSGMNVAGQQGHLSSSGNRECSRSIMAGNHRRRGGCGCASPRRGSPSRAR
jgi:AcrR family transcriptional regulator